MKNKNSISEKEKIVNSETKKGLKQSTNETQRNDNLKQIRYI